MSPWNSCPNISWSEKKQFPENPTTPFHPRTDEKRFKWKVEWILFGKKIDPISVECDFSHKQASQRVYPFGPIFRGFHSLFVFRECNVMGDLGIPGRASLSAIIWGAQNHQISSRYPSAVTKAGKKTCFDAILVKAGAGINIDISSATGCPSSIFSYADSGGISLPERFTCWIYMSAPSAAASGRRCILNCW